MLFLLLPLVLIIAWILYAMGGATMSTDDAYVEANTVGVSTDVSGIVAQVYVKENQHVTRGQILYTLGPRHYRYALDRADAELGTVRDNLLAQQASYRRDAGEDRTGAVRPGLQSGVVPACAESRPRAHRLQHGLRHRASRPVESSQQALASLNAQLAGMARQPERARRRGRWSSTRNT